MSGAARLAAFGVLLVALFAVAWIAGAKLDPQVKDSGHAGDDMSAAASPAEAEPTNAELPGLAVAEAGYRLVYERTAFDPGRRVLRFRIVTADGSTVEDFDIEHTRRMHLIIVRRDFADFQHLHPVQLADGSWKADADLGQAGVYRAFADFSSGGQALTLATDLFVSGRYEARTLPAPRSIAAAGDGYRVEIASDRAEAGAAGSVAFEVSRRGHELESVEPYLGADGHLVALREHDQAFLHVHPEGEPGGFGPIRFQVEYPSPGRYRLFLQFKDRGLIRTAAFTQVAVVREATEAGTTAEEEAHGH